MKKVDLTNNQTDPPAKGHLLHGWKVVVINFDLQECVKLYTCNKALIQNHSEVLQPHRNHTQPVIKMMLQHLWHRPPHTAEAKSPPCNRLLNSLPGLNFDRLSSVYIHKDNW